MMDDRARVSHEQYMGCGVCESKCPAPAISLKRDPARCEPLDMRVFMERNHTV